MKEDEEEHRGWGRREVINERALKFKAMIVESARFDIISRRRV